MILALHGRPHSSECAVSEHRAPLDRLIEGKSDAAITLMADHLGSITTRALLPRKDSLTDALHAYAVAEGLA